MGCRLPHHRQIMRSNWAHITPFFEYPPVIRKVNYTTNAIESVNMILRKITKNRGSFPSDDALLKLFYLALNNISKKWTMPIRDWKAALTRFTILRRECPRIKLQHIRHLYKIRDTLTNLGLVCTFRRTKSNNTVVFCVEVPALSGIQTA